MVLKEGGLIWFAEKMETVKHFLGKVSNFLSCEYILVNHVCIHADNDDAKNIFASDIYNDDDWNILVGNAYIHDDDDDDDANVLVGDAHIYDVSSSWFPFPKFSADNNIYHQGKGSIKRREEELFKGYVDKQERKV